MNHLTEQQLIDKSVQHWTNHCNNRKRWKTQNYALLVLFLVSLPFLIAFP